MRVQRFAGPQGQSVTVVAGITGLAQDAELLRRELGFRRPTKILLGVPYEDLDAIRATAGKQAETTFESAELDDVYLERLKQHGAVESPPPDLYVAFQFGTEAGVPVDAIDLGDEAYTESYTKNVGFFEVMRSNRRQRRLPALSFDAKDADDFVVAWDRALNGSKGLQRVQQAREEHMAKLIASSDGALALVPLARMAGIRDRLLAAGWRAA